MLARKRHPHAPSTKTEGWNRKNGHICRYLTQNGETERYSWEYRRRSMVNPRDRVGNAEAQLFPSAFLSGRSGRGSGAKNSSFPSTSLQPASRGANYICIPSWQEGQQTDSVRRCECRTGQQREVWGKRSL